MTEKIIFKGKKSAERTETKKQREKYSQREREREQKITYCIVP